MFFSQARQIAADIVGRMTIEEKASVIRYDSPAVERLGIHEYNWWNEASHGVARSGMATVFPHAIAMAATFDPELIGKIGDAVSTEARAKYNNSLEKGDRDIFKGLTYWTPNINIFRDPRWGRGQETFGEDPFLTASLAAEYIKGLQGDGEFLKSAACAKHFAVHSGPENIRHSFNAVVTDHDLWETYLPAFEWSVKAGVAGVMGAYNRTNGEPCCAHTVLMQKILREKWGFEGYYVSDCGAIFDIFTNHKYVDSLTEAVAVALKKGCNVNCGDAYRVILDAYEEDLIDETDITDAAVAALSVRVMLGEFEDERPYSSVPFEKIECDEHRDLNLQAARECVVLLKNDGILPLDPGTGKRISVIGPNASSVIALEGNYNGISANNVTLADGVKKVFRDADVRVCKGCNIMHSRYNDCKGFANMKSEGIGFAERSDYTILCLGLDCTVEGEENDVVNEYFNKGDRASLKLPKTQMELAEAVCDVCENLIVVVLAGSCVDLGEKVTGHAKAIIHGWYPGAAGGLAIAEIIAGLHNPSGRLPLTFYRDGAALPNFTDYSMKNRTYRYYEGDVLYPFGYGLSYTKFEYSDAGIMSETDDEYLIRVRLSNTGHADGTEIVQIYASYKDSRTVTPRFQLCGLGKCRIEAGGSVQTVIHVNKYWTSAVLDNGERVRPDGGIIFYVGGHQPDRRSCSLSGTECLEIRV
ncbi:MAG: glycoside hydrolase family 3 C-terminal domain-containing protein [Clostridia bacterium]|nr:glycoside hydrolase family 3 C-terminal domain-containing protein [Clostridia bacterium]